MRFVKAFLVVLLFSQLVVLAVNCYQDSDGRLWRGYPDEQWMASKMLAGYDISGPQDMRVRALTVEVIRQSSDVPEFIVLGSSRTLLVGDKMLDRSGVRNHSVSSARLVHYLGVVGQYRQRGAIPKKVLVGADPWLFKEEHLSIWPMEPGLKSMAPLIRVDAKRLGLDDDFPWQGYFSGLKVWSDFSKGGEGGGACELRELRRDDNSRCAVRRHDGTLKYPADWEEKSSEDVAEEIRYSARGRMHSFAGYRKLDPIRVKAFRDFLAWLQAEGSKVVIFLPPYHPLVEEHQQGRLDWKLVQEAERAIRSSADSLGIPVLGAYSAHLAGCSSDEFFDGIHAKESCVGRILSPLSTSAKAAVAAPLR